MHIDWSKQEYTQKNIQYAAKKPKLYAFTQFYKLGLTTQLAEQCLQSAIKRQNLDVFKLLEKEFKEDMYTHIKYAINAGKQKILAYIFDQYNIDLTKIRRGNSYYYQDNNFSNYTNGRQLVKLLAQYEKYHNYLLTHCDIYKCYDYDIYPVFMKFLKDMSHDQKNCFINNVVNHTNFHSKILHKRLKYLQAVVDSMVIPKTSLINAIRTNKNPYLIRALLNHPDIDPSLEDNLAWIEACITPNNETIKYLLECPEVNPRARNYLGVFYLLKNDYTVKYLTTCDRIDLHVFNNQFILTSMKHNNLFNINELLGTYTKADHFDLNYILKIAKKYYPLYVNTIENYMIKLQLMVPAPSKQDQDQLVQNQMSVIY